MPTNQSNDMMVYCSFCGKNQDEVQKIIAGNNAFICNECVELAQEIIREELAEEVFGRPFRGSKNQSNYSISLTTMSSVRIVLNEPSQ